MKKDVIAVVTFLVTGLLFYLAQTEGKVSQELASESDCGALETPAPADQSAWEGTHPGAVGPRIQDT